MIKLLFKILLLSNLLYAADNIFLHQFFNDKVCDQVLNNDGYFKTCYDYKAKGAKFVAYTIYGSLVNQKNIKKRPRFYQDLHIPKRYRSSSNDYTRNIYSMDRGHLAEDASFDYSQRSLNAVYTMSNIIPQHSTINRGKKAWAGLEKFGRALAVKMGKINVLNGVIYSKNPKRIGHDQIAVPEAYWKLYYSDDMKYLRGFYFENKKITDNRKKIKDYEIDYRKLL